MATNTYVALETKTLTSAVSSVTFSSIPQGYTDLVLVVTGTATGSQDVMVTFNGDSSSSYSDTILYGNGTSAGSVRHTSNTAMFSDYYGSMGTDQGVRTIHLMNYSNTTTYKTALIRASRAGSGVDAIVGLWRSTAAISSISLNMAATNFNIGSTFTIYGIASEEASAKATGGTIVSDSTYFYHIFKNSGTFTSKQSLTADVLVIGGGGGGRPSYGGGGGGAGGVSYSSLSFTATSYTVTVGSGGASGTAGTSSTLSTLTSGGGLSGAGVGGGSTGGASGSPQSNAGGSPSGTSNWDERGGGGGGAGSAGNSYSGSVGGLGGSGTSTYSAIATATGTGVNGYYAGGGGGGGARDTTSGLGQHGGGNGGATADTNGSAALANTGAGGGGSRGSAIGGQGGSGLVIVRYAR